MAAITYTLNFTSGSKATFAVPPGDFDGPLHLLETPPRTSKVHTSLNLPGAGTLRYGEMINEDLIWLLENFANTTPPAAPTVGQMWYDTASNGLNVYTTGGSWAGVPAVNNPTPRDGDMRIVGNVILIYAQGSYRQIYPALLDGVIGLTDDWGFVNEIEIEMLDWGLVSDIVSEFDEWGSVSDTI